MEVPVGTIVGLVIIIACIAVPWYSIAWWASVMDHIPNSSQVKVSQINVGWDWWTNSWTTEVLGFDGKERLDFWDNQSSLFLPNHEYLIDYHNGYRGFWPIARWTIDNVTEIVNTP